MRTFFLILCGLLTTTMAKSQEVIDNFQVGPYEVDYLGKGDVNFRCRKVTFPRSTFVMTCKSVIYNVV